MAEPPAPPSTEFDLARAAVQAEYEIVSEIGRGGMAVVYRAIERELDREVALKLLPVSLAGDAQMVERFLREARMAARLEHPHVVPIWRVGRAGGLPFIAMKLVHGPTLGELLHSRGTLPGMQVRRLLVETASALAHAHGCGIVHRDIKPDNILLEPDGRALVTDFGIARAAREGRLTASGTAIGTPRYMSPEQARSRPVDGRSDLYALGIVAYECLVGRIPFDGDDPVAILLAHVEQPLPEPDLRDPEAIALWPVVKRLLEKHPDDRFADAGALLRALGATTDSAVHTLPTQRFSTPADLTPPPGRVRRAARGLARHPLSLVAAVAVVAIGAAVAFLPGGATFGRPECPPLAAGETWTMGIVAPPTARPGDLLRLDVDLCGLPKGSLASTTVVLRPANPRLAGRDARPSRTVYRDTLPGDVRRTRNIKLPPVPPGEYVLAVSVKPERGAAREQRSPLRVGWDAR